MKCIAAILVSLTIISIAVSASIENKVIAPTNESYTNLIEASSQVADPSACKAVEAHKKAFLEGGPSAVESGKKVYECLKSKMNGLKNHACAKKAKKAKKALVEGKPAAKDHVDSLQKCVKAHLCAKKHKKNAKKALLEGKPDESLLHKTFEALCHHNKKGNKAAAKKAMFLEEPKKCSPAKVAKHVEKAKKALLEGKPEKAEKSATKAAKAKAECGKICPKGAAKEHDKSAS
jgi:hypothetical protein